MVAQVMPVSADLIVGIVIQIIFSTITAWLSAQLVASGSTLQDALIFAIVTFAAVFFISSVSGSIPTFPFINTIILVQAIVKTVVAMKLFNTDFRGGFCIAGVQILFAAIISLPFSY